jgi:DNA topoisomerase-3
MSYAKVLGATSRKDGYQEGNGYLVSWCVGHLVELAPPNIYDEKFVKWSIADLPILPQKWQYLVSAGTKKQFGILKDLMHRPDVDSIVCGTDAGREGELIFRLVYQQARCKKSFSRLWLSSMEDSAIREGFANLKPSTEYDALYQAALCRERADWMVGINASRLFSCLYGQPLAVGRVMTPVLAMTVVREVAIAAFVPQKFYTVELELTSGCTASSRRISEKDAAETLLAECRKEMISTIQKVTRKEKSENPPLLYDLTTLQRDANRLLGYSAQQTLNYVQSLYEKKLTTYPRTDSCYITDDDEEMLAGLADELEKFLGIAADTADSAVPRTRRTVNRDKVTDHHAILPTRSMLQADLDALPTGERNILKLIIARTLMAVSKPYRYLETLLTTECAGEEFTAKGKEILEEGWKAVERKVLADILNRKKEFTILPDVKESECAILNAEMKEGQTTPPKHFTEDTLLHSMETASADSMPEGVERQGIGTPATRAATIEKLVQKGFLERKGEKKTKILLPTDKGKALITVMPEAIQSPEMTADWETKLLRIERGEMEPKEFMTEIKDMITSLVENSEVVKGANVLMKNKIVGVCPSCGKSVVEREKGYFCENRECRFVLWKDNAFFKRLGKRMDSHVADKLLRNGRVRLKDCKSAKGKTYNATVLLSTENDGRSKFSLEFEGGC